MSDRRRMSRSSRARALAHPRRLSHVSRQGRLKGPAATADDTADAVVRSGIWYRAVLSGRQIAAGSLTVLCEQFAVTIRDAGEPAGACLFGITDEAVDDAERSDESASTEVFFSPRAISVIPRMLASCDARPSAAPERAHATLLVGRPTDWDLLPRPTH